MAACMAMDICRATLYRQERPRSNVLAPSKDKTDPRVLRPEEKQKVLDIMHSERFVDQSPAEAYATLLDEGTYLCSVRTIYRILGQANEIKERRDQARHPSYQKPELLARGPNEVWSWDITKLLGPVKWSYFYLYVILDIFSRYVVGWMVAHRESAVLSERLISSSYATQGIKPGQLTIHADRGSSMRSKPVAMLLSDLGITKTHSRPQISNDNPFSKSQFKTLKYRPEFPDRFGCCEDGRLFCRGFFDWYNNEHHHSGLGLLTPATVHYGRAQAVIARRHEVLSGFHGLHPERFVKGPPKPGRVPEAVWINPPIKTTHQDALGLTISSQAAVVVGSDGGSQKIAISSGNSSSSEDRLLVEAIQ
jgi:putative transposase